jgi:serine/threonine-protein kinase
VTVPPEHGPAEQLQLLWQQGQQPDVNEFLARAGSLMPAQVAAVLRVDQRWRWQAGQRVVAEVYLQYHPEICSDAEAWLDLIYNEFLLRERLREQPDLAEYVRRFPVQAEQLRAQIELHCALKPNQPVDPAPPMTGGPTGPSPSTVGVDQPVKEALVPGAVRPRLAEDVRSLLHRRLLFLAVMFSLGMVAWVALALLEIVAHRGQIPLDGWLYLGVAAFMMTLGAVLSTVLWRQSLSLRRLRALELVLFGAIYLLWTTLHTHFYPQLRLPNPPGWFGAVMAHSVSIPWSFMIIAYGIFIPNTWRRCAAVVGVMALTPFVTSAATGLAAEVTEGHSPASFFITVAVWISTATAIAVYGAHRIEVLRQEVVAARRLGPYQLKKRLGAGGMGEVYLAEHVLLKRPCAVKLIRPERAGNPAELQRFEREVRATSALTHPNTVQVFDYGHADDGTFYYAMEYLPGINLDELVVKHGPLPPARAIHLLRQLCGALAEAHAAGLIHRDIKPGNVIVGERGGRHDVVKLLDFGLVRSQSGGPDETRLTQEGAIAGTPAFMSPEQAGGQPDLNGRSDIYSLGALAYFLLAGQAPFAGRSMIHVLLAHISEPPKPLTDHCPDAPADLQAVVLRCLAKKPSERFSDVQSMEQALTACAAAGAWTEAEAAAWWRSLPDSPRGPSAAPVVVPRLEEAATLSTPTARRSC